MTTSCDACGATFSSLSAVKSHKKATGHCVCQICTKVLACVQGLNQHHVAVHRRKCPQCSEGFVSMEALRKHQRSAGHCFCGDCNRVFDSLVALQAHLQSSLHSTEFRCCDCNHSFRTSRSLEQHLRDATHRKKDNASLECKQCRRTFKNQNALRQHQASPVHHPLCRLSCVSTCKRHFSTPSGFIHHLESGTCSSGMNRQKLNHLIRNYDSERLLTKSSQDSDSVVQLRDQLSEKRLASVGPVSNMSNAVSSGTTSSVSSPPPTPNILTPGSETTSYNEWAALVAHGSQSCCPFCPSTRKPFRSKMALQCHVSSAAHSERWIVCPAAAGQFSASLQSTKRIISFTTVSGLAQHLESGRCVGGISTFRQAAQLLENLLKKWGFNVRLTDANIPKGYLSP